jgi:hypothetical protein
MGSFLSVAAVENLAAPPAHVTLAHLFAPPEKDHECYDYNALVLIGTL